MLRNILIAHKGNIDGPNLGRENTKAYLKEALSAGFHVECDVRSTPKGLYLGHDDPQEPADKTLLFTPGVWVHAKDWEALHILYIMRVPIFFYQTSKEKYSLVSNGYLWANIGQVEKDVILVDPKGESSRLVLDIVAGVCSDYISKYQ